MKGWLGLLDMCNYIVIVELGDVKKSLADTVMAFHRGLGSL